MPRPGYDPAARARLLQRKVKAGSGLPSGVTRRGALNAIKAVSLLDLSPSRKRDAQLLCAARAKSTTTIHNHVITFYTSFLRKHGLPVNTFDERTLISFAHFCEDTKKPYSFMKQIPGSLRSWCYILNKSMSEYTPRAQRILEGVTRRAAAERRPVRKATPIPQEVMRRALLRLVRGYQSVWDIPLPEFRACVALILQFHHFTRLGDLDELRACHISQDVVGGTQVLKVIYPKRKNDQERLGSESLLFAEESDICPVKLISLYFTRSGFRFFDGRCVDTNFVFCRTNCLYTSTGKQTVSDGRFAISVGTLLRDIQRICSGAGYGGKIGRKSGKMAGVSAACDAGLSDEALRDKGRWRSTEMSQHYRQHTTKYLHALGSCISLDGNHNGLQAARQSNVPIFRNCVLQRNLATPPPPLSARETSPVHTPVRNLPRPVFAQPPPRPAPRPSPAPARSPPTPISRRFRQPPPPLPQATKISASARLFHTPRSYGARAATGTLHNIQLVSPFNQATHFIDDTVYHPAGFRRGGAAIRSWLQ